MNIKEKRVILVEYIKCDFCPICSRPERVSFMKCGHCNSDVCHDHYKEMKSGHQDREIPVDKNKPITLKVEPNGWWRLCPNCSNLYSIKRLNKKEKKIK